MPSKNNKTDTRDKLVRVIISLIIVIIATSFVLFETYNENLSKNSRILIGIIFCIAILFAGFFPHLKNKK
ncbi:hypothetical protein SAMN05444673_3997 [Bacillus sp. OV166]|uniref:hypothetical protein n=1 Tax=Bacillus sp. OV166 TaxID=1882763 RepID=UPI000A2AE5C3|nr:hypothetical protein [Bacillus sp. OV166]SMQ80812.1 hypothetical protein SAMN05444673_3997 [Bacillus sp. OV166]